MEYFCFSSLRLKSCWRISILKGIGESMPLRTTLLLGFASNPLQAVAETIPKVSIQTNT
jgi:hypothetical protein